MLKIQKFVFSPFIENTYLIWDSESLEAAVIDPGNYDDSENRVLKDSIESENLKLLYLINTHCHIDHIFGNDFIKKIFECKFYAPEHDVFILDMMPEQAKVYGVKLTPSPNPDEFITENTIIKLGNLTGEFLFTPGHTPGEHCLLFRNEKVCFTGDVLFNMSIGRTDLWGGDYKTLLESIKQKLLVLPDDTKVYPGHEKESTIGFEKRNNPFLQ